MYHHAGYIYNHDGTDITEDPDCLDYDPTELDDDDDHWLYHKQCDNCQFTFSRNETEEHDGKLYCPYCGAKVED